MGVNESAIAMFAVASPPLVDFPVAYVGLGPGQEFIPYFFALLAWGAMAFLAILQWPIVRLVRSLRKSKAEPPAAAPVQNIASPPAAATDPGASPQ